MGKSVVLRIQWFCIYFSYFLIYFCFCCLRFWCHFKTKQSKTEKQKKKKTSSKIHKSCIYHCLTPLSAYKHF